MEPEFMVSQTMSQLGQNRKSSMRAYVFRCSPNNGHRQDTSACPFRATTGLMHRSKLDAGQPVKSVRRITLARPRQYDLELSKKSGLRLDINAAAVLFHYDVMAHGQPEPSTFASGFRCEKRVENLFPNLQWDARTIVANADLDPFAEISSQPSALARSRCWLQRRAWLRRKARSRSGSRAPE